jgi:hypothetical protein
MELDLVDAVPEPVVRAEDGRMRVCLVAPGDRFRPTGDFAEALQTLAGPARVLALDAFCESAVFLEEIVALQRWRLVQDLVRRTRHSISSIAASRF